MSLKGISLIIPVIWVWSIDFAQDGCWHLSCPKGTEILRMRMGLI